MFQLAIQSPLAIGVCKPWQQQLSALRQPNFDHFSEQKSPNLPKGDTGPMINFIVNRLLKRAGLTPEALRDLVEEGTKELDELSDLQTDLGRMAKR